MASTYRQKLEPVTALALELDSAKGRELAKAKVLELAKDSAPAKALDSGRDSAKAQAPDLGHGGHLQVWTSIRRACLRRLREC